MSSSAVFINEYQPVLPRNSYGKYLPKSSKGEGISEIAEKFFLQEQGGLSTVYKSQKFIGDLGSRLNVGGEFSKKLSEIGSTGFSFGSITYCGFRATVLRKAIADVIKNPCKTTSISLLYAIAELIASALYTIKLFLPIGFVQSAINVVSPFSVGAEFAEACQEIVDDREYAKWVQDNQGNAKWIYAHALRDKLVEQLSANYFPSEVDLEDENLKGKVKWAEAWLNDSNNGELVKKKAQEVINSFPKPLEEEEAKNVLKARIVVQLSLEANATKIVNETGGGIVTKMVEEIVPKAYKERESKGWIATAKVIMSTVILLLSWTQLAMAFFAITALSATVAIGWVSFALGGVALACSIVRALYREEYKVERVTKGWAEQALEQIRELEALNQTRNIGKLLNLTAF